MLADFAGRWRLSRRIADRRSGQSGHAVGWLDLVPEGNGLAYRESVTLHLAEAPPIHGTRTYSWHPAAAGIAVHFDDGRPFHVIAAGDVQPEAEHFCDPDEYRVRYDFSDWPVWSVIWEVGGPRKNYRMETLFARACAKPTET